MAKTSTGGEGGRAALLWRLQAALREASAQGVLISQTIAGRVGLNASDLECLDLIQLQGPRTAGELAKATGLTSGAITGLIDRLERAGYVTREGDPGDRRRVVVRVRPEALTELNALYRPLQIASQDLNAGYSDAELALIAAFMERNIAMARDFIAGLKAPP
ncbi:MAG TPA: MarR family transcriptional regulator [Caulobacter sp.]|nr:MarR family transcriptional regulator [Caulobacter sp.]